MFSLTAQEKQKNMKRKKKGEEKVVSEEKRYTPDFLGVCLPTCKGEWDVEGNIHKTHIHTYMI